MLFSLHEYLFLTFPCRRQPIAKIQHFYEVTVQNMTPRYFRRYFRCNKETLQNLVHYISPVNLLYQHPSYTRITIEKKIAMTLAYLGSSATTLQYKHSFQCICTCTCLYFCTS